MKHLPTFIFLMLPLQGKICWMKLYWLDRCNRIEFNTQQCIWMSFVIAFVYIFSLKSTASSPFIFYVKSVVLTTDQAVTGAVVSQGEIETLPDSCFPFYSFCQTWPRLGWLDFWLVQVSNGALLLVQKLILTSRSKSFILDNNCQTFTLTLKNKVKRTN